MRTEQRTRIDLSVTPQMYRLLKVIAETGLSGQGVSDVAERLIERGISQLASECQAAELSLQWLREHTS